MHAVQLDCNPAPQLSGQRIVFVFGSLELGGAEQQALILARYLSVEARAEVEVWGFNRTGPVAEICAQSGLGWRIVPYPLAGNPLTCILGLAPLAWLLRRARADIILPYTLLPNVACGLVWRWTGARLCVWNQRDEGIARLNVGLERRAVARVPQFISNSAQGARYLMDRLKASPAKVVVINNGVECFAPRTDRCAWRRQLQLGDECFVACMVANLHQHKDHQTLLLAWRKVLTVLAASGRRAVLVLAGQHDDAYETLLALSYELGIHHTIRFLGHISDIPGLLSAVDLCVFSSRSEGCPNGVLESMAAGLAIAGTDTEGISETVGPAGTPFLAPPGDATALAEIIVKLANDPTLCATLGAANRNRIRDKYDALRMCQETASLLVNCLPT